ncbi:hypothetical protein NKJ04_17725 [Mesorhizobium sp. M0618]|uniref:hypothetical protein n=1 Tax=Mesorhizobium sp. M0618 TaxID=2956972 RepID=UPI003338384F
MTTSQQSQPETGGKIRMTIHVEALPGAGKSRSVEQAVKGLLTEFEVKTISMTEAGRYNETHVFELLLKDLR